MTASNAVADYYKFGMIRRCNDFLTNIQNIEFADAKKKDNMIGQVKTIRAYTYFNMNWQSMAVYLLSILMKQLKKHKFPAIRKKR